MRRGDSAETYLGDAVRLVDGEQRDLDALHHGYEALVVEPAAPNVHPAALRTTARIDVRTVPARRTESSSTPK